MRPTVRLAAMFCIVALPVVAQDWQPVADVYGTLSGRTVQYPSATQAFRSNGSTRYDAGTPSVGRWTESAGRYCSVWPPVESWSCFDVMISGDGSRIRFVDDRGNATDGAFR
ncbi:hypothetical protein ACK8OR_05905 [Jannaschia sp. KMU-145]|uniref:hypothetical protein n=1 Tax=Jannaschia halovivens TaxID=3388667 RepID=UPI00396AFF25